MNDGYEVRRPKLRNCDDCASVSSVARAQRMTIPENVPVGCSSLISSVAEGRVLPHARAECFATFALDVSVDGVDFDEDEGLTEPLETSLHFQSRQSGGTCVEHAHLMLDDAVRDSGVHPHHGAATANDVPLFRGAVNAA
jgi:hypothetical protein